ncbi:MAG TPA: ABC transporter permease [Actinomycetota bacterium]|nr:ABC transporter permease [Actinomycetota bacterium]
MQPETIPSAQQVEVVPEGGAVVAQGSLGRLILRTFLENKLAIIGLGFVVIVTAFSFLGPLVYHTNQIATNLLATNLPPGHGHPFGTDQNGYDVLGRLMAGGQVSMEISIAIALVATTVGALYGAISGFFGGWLDTAMMRIVDVGLAVPVIFLFILLSRIFAPTKVLLIILLAGLSWLGPARLVRGETLSLRTRDYVQAVRSMGGGPRRIILRHIVPNAIGTIVVNATFQIADATLILATLDYLGLGLPPPTATWGGMLSGGVGFLQDGYWWQVYPVLIVIVFTVISFNFIGDALRDSLDVRLRRR